MQLGLELRSFYPQYTFEGGAWMALQVGAPLKTGVWPGAILASIAQAIFVARAPIMSHEHSWDGGSYNVQNSAGSCGTIAFTDSNKDFVGVFYLEESRRNPLRFRSDIFDTTHLLRGLPTALEPVAEEALQYLLQDVRGSTKPVITAAFWSGTTDRLVAAEPWDDVMRNGAILVGIQLANTTDAIIRWQQEFELTTPEVALLKSLFARRMTNPHVPIQLLPGEKQLVERTAAGREGMEACRESLGEIRITLS
jgi:hypothetical protein